MTSSIEATNEAARAVQVAPRVDLADIEKQIAYRLDTTGGRILAHLHGTGSVPFKAASVTVLSICLIVMRNGYTIIGKSAPASPENYDETLGKQFAYEDAIRQLWPLMGFALKDRLWRDSEDAMAFHAAEGTL